MTVPGLRAATDTDAPGVIALVERCWADYEGCVFDLDGEMAHLRHFASFYARRGGRSYVVERLDEVVASVTWDVLDSGFVELHLLYVLPDWRRRGLATSLVGLVERDAGELRAPGVELWSDTRFTDAHRLYRSLGYEQLAEPRELHDLSDSVEYHFVKRFEPMSI